MKQASIAITAMISLYLVFVAPLMAAAYEGPPDETPAAGDDPGTSVAIGKVVVNVVEWSPDLEGVGAGLFTESEFDLPAFFSELFDSLASLFGS
ncbi:MAG: hypothetical protein JXC85_02425 [Candidatus Aenigmarchaeota archaeon]|nr:hypothetical protein [Candidatus Aenigmarchaeota archaeon]